MPGTPNTFATIALILWVPLSLVLPALFRVNLSIAAILLGSTLLLPSAIALWNPPALPALDAKVIASLSALLAALIYCPRQLRISHLAKGPILLLGAMMLGALATALTNADAVTRGSLVLPGLRPSEGFGIAMKDLVTLGVPFFLGATLFRNTRDLERLYALLVLAALAYSAPILFEIRMSPTLNHWVYGYTHGTWSATKRWGGWRPQVFMTHGLALAMFVLASAMAVLCLMRRRSRLGRLPLTPIAAYLMVVLLLCRSTAAIVYGAVSCPLLILARPKLQIRLAACLALLICAYPILRAADLFPTDTVMRTARWVSAERAASLQTRFEHEDQLLSKASDRIWFGWGTWGRNRIYDEETGVDVSLTDGYWIIRLGSQGAVGFVTSFALLLLPVFQINARKFVVRRDDALLLSGGCWIVLAQVLDLIPNGFLNVFTVFFCGSLSAAIREVAQGTQRRARGRPGSEDRSPRPPVSRSRPRGVEFASRSASVIPMEPV